jgi:2-oxoglutarate/2-oxoacid ferredoxin oxidoreductase subunit alpha
LNGELLWKVGGAQGEGIDSSGEIFAQALNRLGYYVFGYRHFMSLIKGGHTYYKVRVSAERPLAYHGDGLQILLAFDQYTIDYNAHELVDGAVVIYDSRFEPKFPEGREILRCPVPIVQTAKSLGSEIMKNIVAVGASAAIVGLSPEDFASVIEDRFGGKKGGDIVAKNMEALRQGYAYCRENFLASHSAEELARFAVPPLGGVAGDAAREVAATAADRPRRMYISGNDLSGMGAIVAGCRFLAAYPITPATDIMYYMLKRMPELGGAVVQAEDEIAALNMAIGAGYTGVRSMTSSSGPGLSLMSEALGFAGIAEVPVVIVDVMRGGPGTGLPTKTEQSDINHLLYTGHGESPRIVLVAMDFEDCFYVMGDAFNLAEYYQVPVIVATDLYLGMSRRNLDGLDFGRIKIDRGTVLTQEQLDEIGKGNYRRYQLTESGISPRSIPGLKGGEYTALSNERDELSREEVEDQYSRVTQHQKRFRKLENLDLSHRVRFDGDETCDLLLVGLGSTWAQLTEAIAELREEGMSVSHLQLGALMPFPTATVAQAMAGAKKVMVVEQNLRGQLAALLKQEIGEHGKISGCLKYNGDPFWVSDIVRAAHEVLAAPMPVSVHISSTGLGGAPEKLEVK